jgi:hypothetical protein
VSRAFHDHLKGFVVVIAAGLTDRHDATSR